MVSFVVRTHGEIPVAAEMRSVFHQTAPGFAVEDFQTMEDAVEKNTFSQRLGLYLVGSFAGLAVVMVVAGLYGVLSQLVSYRRREIGIRMALGATRQSVAQLILRQGSIVIGSGLGVGPSLGDRHRPLGQKLPVPGAAGGYVDLCIGGRGALDDRIDRSLLPARKAASIEPMQALREE